MDISALKALYRGFYIDAPIGNNAFSFERRSHRRIFVPPLRSGGIADVARGSEIVFSEVVDEPSGVSREVNVTGLKEFIHIDRGEQQVFIFDNHNHAFFFWCAAIVSGVIPYGFPVVHVDQHKDTREPPEWSSPMVSLDLVEAYRYTNEVLNVGNFIPPAVQTGITGRVTQVGSQEAFHSEILTPYILDIDLDIFAPSMDYIPEDLKVAKIREWMSETSLVTIATSPFFIDQDLMVGYLHKLLDS